MSEIMSYYNPKILVVGTMSITFVVAWGFPLYGYIFSKILFVMMAYGTPNYNYVFEYNFWCGMFLVLGVVLGFGSMI